MARLRDYLFYDTAVSICSQCYKRVDAKILFEDGAVWMAKRCPEHGAEKVMIADDIDYYRQCRERYLKTPEQPLCYNTASQYGCPYDCGICPDHEQHGCILLLEITERCNLSCPTCYASSSPQRLTHRSMQQIDAMLARAIKNEGEPSILQISGGEPTVHPEFFKILDKALALPIGYLMVNTNGVRIARDQAFAEQLAAYKDDIEIYLQFDALQPEVLQTLRGEDLVEDRKRALRRLNDMGMPVNLVCTVRRGLNDELLGEIINYALQQECVRGVVFQPVQASGRLERYEQGYQIDRDRITLTEVRRKILQQTPWLAPQDIIPVPCHADAVAMAYAIKQGEQAMPLTGMVTPEMLTELASNTIAFETETRLQQSLFSLYSTHHNPSSMVSSLMSFIGKASGKTPADLVYNDLFRILIVEFIDAYNFDLRSVRKSCVHILHPDGKRVIPFDTYNMFYRDKLEQTRLEPIRQNIPGTGGAISLAKKI